MYEIKCPFCLKSEHKVIDKRISTGSIRRRRECLGCQKRFTTHEEIEPVEFNVDIAVAVVVFP